MTIHKDLLEEMISQWGEKELEIYIAKLQGRIMETEQWLKELRALLRLKKRKSTPDNGARDGR